MPPEKSTQRTSPLRGTGGGILLPAQRKHRSPFWGNCGAFFFLKNKEKSAYFSRVWRLPLRAAAATNPPSATMAKKLGMTMS